MQFSMTAKLAAIILACTATVHGHIVMTNPAPYQYPDAAQKQAPLLESGADYPCKFPAGFTPQEQAPADIAFGINSMTLMGGATHSGGSCQISISKDVPPTKNSKFEVLKSIEGGCPSDFPGNLSDNPSEPLPPLSYTVPQSMAAGKYTIAWTWFNKSGNREMYMNCAPVQLKAAGGKRDVAKISKKRQAGLPTMFIANIGNGCGTTEGSDVTFPDPGQDVSKGGKVIPGAPTGQCAAAGVAPASGPTSPIPAPAPAPADGNKVIPVDPKATNAPAPAPAAPSASAVADGGPCAPEGLYVCAADGRSYTRCASGRMTPPMPMSPGVKCAAGTTAELQMSAGKRGLHFSA
jgi:hypothetical protein